jgi:hypothetical protein
MGFDEVHMLTKSREWANYFFQSYAAAKGKSPFVDKSLGYVGYPDYINQLYPTAQYIMIYRHEEEVAY